MELDEKVELIYDSYTRTLDREIAYLRADLSDEEREAIDEHEGLRIRIMLYDAEIREQLITNLRDLAQSDNEGIRLKATNDLGAMLYKKRFGKQETHDESEVPTRIELVGIKPDAEDADG